MAESGYRLPNNVPYYVGRFYGGNHSTIRRGDSTEVMTMAMQAVFEMKDPGTYKGGEGSEMIEFALGAMLAIDGAAKHERTN